MYRYDKMVKLISNCDRNEYDIRPLVMSFFPGGNMEYSVVSHAEAERIWESAGDNQTEPVSDNIYSIYLILEDKRIRISAGGLDDEVIYNTCPDSKKYRDDLKRLIYRVLSKATGRVNRWGTLTGVRPSKIAMGYLREGMDGDNVIDIMKKEYYCSDGKASLCTEVAHNELRILDMIDYETGYSVYIGIPFCPTVCNYCSFSSVSLSGLKDSRAMMRSYMEALEKECSAIGGLYKGKKLSSIYVGGGTPTALDEECLAWLMRIIRQNFDVDHAFEFNVEAGRPDSINEGKLDILKSAGVTRISVNPQTMKPETLKLMGRNHTTDQVRETFRLARNKGFDNINMDLIAGLMGESTDDFKNTISAVEELNPDSFTVHSLVVKRASKYRTQCEADHVDAWDYDSNSNFNGEVVAGMLDTAAEFAKKAGYIPYYMYRQKNKSGLGSNNVLENVGYAKRGREGIYNIVIMEELQPILAFGAGASSKFLYGSRIERAANVKNVNEYISRIDEMIQRKKRCLING